MPETTNGAARRHRHPRSSWTTPETEHAARLWRAGRTAAEISRTLGKSRNAVLGKIGRMGLARSASAARQAQAAQAPAMVIGVSARRRAGEWTPARTRRLADLWNDGLAADEIAVRIGCSETAVLARVAKIGLAAAEQPERYASPGWYARNDARFRTAMRKALDLGLERLPGEVGNHGA